MRLVVRPACCADGSSGGADSAATIGDGVVVAKAGAADGRRFAHIAAATLGVCAVVGKGSGADGRRAGHIEAAAAAGCRLVIAELAVHEGDIGKGAHPAAIGIGAVILESCGRYTQGVCAIDGATGVNEGGITQESAAHNRSAIIEIERAAGKLSRLIALESAGLYGGHTDAVSAAATPSRRRVIQEAAVHNGGGAVNRRPAAIFFGCIIGKGHPSQGGCPQHTRPAAIDPSAVVDKRSRGDGDVVKPI